MNADTLNTVMARNLLPANVPIGRYKVLVYLFSGETLLAKSEEAITVSKIGFDAKFAMVLLAQHGTRLRNIEDAQLMSYALDAGRGSHGCQRRRSHQCHRA